MLPIPTPAALMLLTGSAIGILVGLLASSPLSTAVSSAGLLVLSCGYAASYPLARRARRMRLEFAWWLTTRGEGESRVLVPRAPFEVCAFLRHASPSTARITQLAPVLSDGLEEVAPRPDMIVVGPKERADFRITLRGKSVGRWVAHGMAARIRGPLGLFELPLYFPHPLPLKILPRPLRRGFGGRPRAPLPQGDRTGRASLRRRGGGTELHELRELQPGDPFKAIAWKTSARLGKLVVKEVEQELSESHHLILDTSPSMRSAPLGSRKLDRAIDLAAGLAKRHLDAGDRVGLIAFDRRVTEALPLGEGRPQLLRILDALIATADVVDEDLTDVDDRMVAAHVARYLRHQVGLEFRAVEPGGTTISRSLIRHVRSTIGDDLGRVRASATQGRALRRFCQLQGIPLPYRSFTPDFEKTGALRRAFDGVHAAGRSTTHLTLITDGEDLLFDEQTFAHMRLLRAHGHDLEVLILETEEDEPTDRPVLDALRAVYRRREQRRHRKLRNTLARIGASSRIVRGRRVAPNDETRGTASSEAA